MLLVQAAYDAMTLREANSGTVIRTLCFLCRGHRFRPCLWNSDPTAAQIGQEGKKKKGKERVAKRDSCPR